MTPRAEGAIDRARVAGLAARMRRRGESWQSRRGVLARAGIVIVVALAFALVAATVGRPSQRTFPGAAGKIAVSSGGASGGIELMNPDGTSRTRITFRGGNGVVWSPDGKWLAYSTFPNPWVIRVVRPDGSGDREVLSARDSPILYPAFAWSPTGSEIAFACSTGLCAVRVADGVTRRLVDVPARTGAARPSWAPDGSKIAFECTVGSGICIVSLNAPDSIEALTFSAASGSRARFPDWSPDGSSLLVTVRTKLYVLNLVQSQARLLVDMGGTLLAHGRWSPDGQSALVGSFPDLYVMRLDATKPEKIGTFFEIGDWGTSPALVVARAQLQPRWVLSKQAGALVLEGTASHATDLSVTLKSATHTHAPVSASVPVGAFSVRLKLPPNMAPGEYQAAVEGSSGTERVLSSSFSVRLPAPATGLVYRSGISDRRGGQARERAPSTTKALYARFDFSVRPAAGQTLTAVWIAPSGAVRLRQRVASAPIARSALTNTSPLQAGRWRCRLEAGRIPLAVATIRVG